MNNPSFISRPNRRQFLSQTGSALIGSSAVLMANSYVKAAQSPSNAKKDVKVRLAVVGGYFGACHFWHEHPNCQVTAVTDLVEDRRQRLMKAYHCQNAYPSLEVMLKQAAETFDAVAIFTEGPNHAKHALMCFDAGKHVVSAVPMAFSLEDCQKIIQAKQKTGLKYMMHETSYYRQACITAREAYQKGMFGRVCLTEAEYYHPGIGGRTDCMKRLHQLKHWRYGLPPMNYPTHAIAFLVGVTGEHITKVSCMGQHVGDDFPAADENPYHNPFNNEYAIGHTDKGNICRFAIFWDVAAEGERAQWLGDLASCYMESSGGQTEAMMLSDAAKQLGEKSSRHREIYGDQLKAYQHSKKSWVDWMIPEYYKTDRLPKPMRHKSGHGHSHTFLSAEFIDAIIEDREPTVDVNAAYHMTAPGIVAHQSALKDGELMPVPLLT